MREDIIERGARALYALDMEAAGLSTELVQVTQTDREYLEQGGWWEKATAVLDAALTEPLAKSREGQR